MFIIIGKYTETSICWQLISKHDVAFVFQVLFF